MGSRVRAMEQCMRDGTPFRECRDAILRCRSKAQLADQVDRWWARDDTVKEVTRQLKRNYVAVIDGFFVRSFANTIHAAVVQARENGELKKAVAAPRSSDGIGDAILNEDSRGDAVKWVDAADDGFGCIEKYTECLTTFVKALARKL